MKIETEYMGAVDYTEEEIIHFPNGIYGFPASTRYLIVGTMTAEFPFIWLQSIDEADVSFVLTNPFLFAGDYDFELSDSALKLLKLEEVEDVEVLTTVIVKEEIQESTINLKSPIIVNRKERIAAQVVLDEDYPFKYFLFKNKEGTPC